MTGERRPTQMDGDRDHHRASSLSAPPSPSAAVAAPSSLPLLSRAVPLENEKSAVASVGARVKRRTRTRFSRRLPSKQRKNLKYRSLLFLRRRRQGRSATIATLASTTTTPAYPLFPAALPPQQEEKRRRSREESLFG